MIELTILWLHLEKINVIIKNNYYVKYSKNQEAVLYYRILINF